MPIPHVPVFTPPPHPPLATPLAQNATRLLLRTARSTLAWTPPPSSPFQPVAAYSLRVVPVRGDGRCLYRAIAKGLAAMEKRRLPESLEREDADALRAMAWKAMCVDRLKEFESRHVVEGSLRQYCAAMRSPTFYAGEAEMLALADVLRVPIRVYLRQREGLRNLVTYGEKWGGEGVRVLYVNGNHYDALLPR